MQKAEAIRCPRCEEERPPTDFERDRTKPGGRSRYCRMCKREMARESRERAGLGSYGERKRRPGGPRRRKRRLTRLERIAGSLLAAEAEITHQRRRIHDATARIAETKVHAKRLRELQARLSKEQDKAA